MAEVKQDVAELPNTNYKINEETELNVNQFEVIDAFIETGTEVRKIYPA